MDVQSEKSQTVVDTLLLDQASLFEHLVSSQCCDSDESHYLRCMTPLDFAARKNLLWMVKRLLEVGADIKKAKHALWEAIEHNNLEMVQALTRAGAEVNGYPEDESRPTPLIGAMRMGSLEICQVLLEAGADPNPKTNSGLHILPFRPFPLNGFKELLKLLIDFGFNVNATGWDGYTTMHNAILEFGISNPDVCSQYVKILLDAGAHPDYKTQSDETPLSLAITQSCGDCVDILLAAGCDLNFRTNAGHMTYLYRAVILRNLDLVRKLVTAGADPNIPNDGNTTPLCAAVSIGLVRTVRYLVSLNVDLEVPSFQAHILLNPSSKLNKRTALLYAVIHREWEIIEVLIEAGYDIWRESWLKTGSQALTAKDVGRDAKRDWQEIKKIVKRLTDLCCTVPSLQHVCKMVIRKTYRTGLSERLRSLEFPKALKNYLLMDEIQNQTKTIN